MDFALYPPSSLEHLIGLHLGRCRYIWVLSLLLLALSLIRTISSQRAEQTSLVELEKGADVASHWLILHNLYPPRVNSRRSDCELESR
jgi:hypothetical protein